MKTLVLSSVLFLSVCNFGCVRPVVMAGTSMLPSYNEGDRIMLNTSFGELKRGDVVSHLYPKNLQQGYMKRIIGLPNETVEIKNGIVFVEGNQLDEPYIDTKLNQGMTNLPTVKIDSDSYFVMGDNRDNSSDSRIWGTVKKDLIKGVVWFKYADGSKNK
jgi:signal peptidase I